MIPATSRSRGTLAGTVGLPAVAAATTWVAMYAWRGFTESPGGFLNPLFLLALLVAGTGIAPRWWRAPSALVLLGQVVVSGVVAMLLLIGSPLPVGDGWGELHRALADAVHSSQQYAAPVPANAAPLDPLLILCGLVCLLLVDLLACTLRRVPLAGLPLLTIYSIPVSMVGHSISWWVFAMTAAGFLSMLFLQESDQVARWGRPIGVDRETGDPISFGAGAARGPQHGHQGRRRGHRTGDLPARTASRPPACTCSTSDRAAATGTTSGSTTRPPTWSATSSAAPTRRWCRSPRPTRNPSYLRILTLTRFTDVEWSPGDRDVPSDQRADGSALPRLQGVASAVARDEVPYDVTILPAIPVPLAADPVTDQQDPGRRRLALRHPDDGLPGRARRPVDREPALLDERGAARPHRRPPGERGQLGRQGQRGVHRRTVRPPADRAAARRRCHPRRDRPLRGGGRPPELVPRGRRLHLLPRHRRGQRIRRAGQLPQRRPWRPHRLLRAVRLLDGGDGAGAGHPGPGRDRLPAAAAGRDRTPGSTAPTTCTPGPSCTSRAPAGCGSSRRRPAARRTSRATPGSTPGS